MQRNITIQTLGSAPVLSPKFCACTSNIPIVDLEFDPARVIFVVMTDSAVLLQKMLLRSNRQAGRRIHLPWQQGSHQQRLSSLVFPPRTSNSNPLCPARAARFRGRQVEITTAAAGQFQRVKSLGTRSTVTVPQGQ
jgi:hypothetical protein